MVASQLSQYNFRGSPSWTLQIAGLDNAERRLHFSSSSVVSLWSLVNFLRRWAWLQKSHKKWQHTLHLTTTGSPEEQSSQTIVAESAACVFFWRLSWDIKLFKKKLTWSSSTLPSETYRESKNTKFFISCCCCCCFLSYVVIKIVLSVTTLGNCISSCTI